MSARVVPCRLWSDSESHTKRVHQITRHRAHGRSSADAEQIRVGTRRHVPHDIAESDDTQEILGGIDGCPRSPDTPTWSKGCTAHRINQSKVGKLQGTRCCSFQPSTQSTPRCFYCRWSWNVQGSSTSIGWPRRTPPPPPPEHSSPEECLLPWSRRLKMSPSNSRICDSSHLWASRLTGSVTWS